MIHMNVTSCCGKGGAVSVVDSQQDVCVCAVLQSSKKWKLFHFSVAAGWSLLPFFLASDIRDGYHFSVLDSSHFFSGKDTQTYIYTES